MRSIHKSTYLTSRLFSQVACIFLWLCASFPLLAGIRDDLYTKGNDAAKKKDYLEAVKYLYAYYIVNQDAIDKNLNFKELLLGKIKELEGSLVKPQITSEFRGTGSPR